MALSANACTGVGDQVAPRAAETAAQASAERPGAPKPPALKPSSASPSPPALEWKADYAAPRPGSPADPALSVLAEGCGAGDEGLHQVAQAAARYLSDHGQAPEPDWTLFELGRNGVPYVLPRLWSADVPADADDGLVATHIRNWSEERPVRGEARCGVGEVAREDGSRSVAVVWVDARSDLAALPLAPALGASLTLRARLLVPATDTEVVVLPPGGRPRPLATKTKGDAVEAKIRVDREGPWLLQLLANDEGGPLPALAFTLWVGAKPPANFEAGTVPGEDAAGPESTPEEALLAMSNAARRASGLPPFTRRSALDVLAREHARAMQKWREMTHDSGDGNPARRVEAAGISARAVGENVARAATLKRAHRALWASPSHRGNLLAPHFDEIGIGVAPDGAGWYVSLLFVESVRHHTQGANVGDGSSHVMR